MYKHITVMVVLSAIAAFLFAELKTILHYIGYFQAGLISKIYAISPATPHFRIISTIIVLIILPLLISLICAFIYWLAKHKELPWTKEIMWCLWIILLITLVLFK